MWSEILAKVKAIMTANSLVQEVYDYEAEEFKGNPSVTITPSANESSYDSTIHNRRVFAFTIRMFVQRGSEGGIDNRRCDELMRNLVDSVLDDLDKNYTLSGIVNPTGYQMLFMEAAPSAWGYAGREYAYRIAEIEIKVHVHVDVTLIS